MSGPVPLPQPHQVKRDGWTRGRWDDEADSHQWVTAAGLRAAWIRDPHLGFLCGYVEAPESMRGVDYADTEYEVHGGLTFSGSLAGQTWWFGFDCAHAGDARPDETWSSVLGSASKRAVYRTAGFVEAQCEKLAAQLAAVAS